MRVAWRSLLVCGLMSVACWPGAARAEGSASAGQTESALSAPPAAEKPSGEATEPSSTFFSLAGPLVIEGSPTEADEQRAAEEARLASPEAVQAREESELAYSGLSSTESKELASSTFPALVDDPNGGAPK